MDTKMFCFQCEETASCTACTGAAGVCGKDAEVAHLQDVLTGALIALARVAQNAGAAGAAGAASCEACGCGAAGANVAGAQNAGEPNAAANAAPIVAKTIIEGLFTTVTNVNFNEATMHALIDEAHALTGKIASESGATSSNSNLSAASCENAGENAAADYDIEQIWAEDDDIRSLKSLVLFGLRGMAAYAHHAMVLGYTDAGLNDFFVKALVKLGEKLDMNALVALAMEVGEHNLTCMALLDKANTQTYGTPTPAQVPLTIEKGPFIVITGHDLHDLQLLLEQTEGKGINIYTHSEMLPAHGYPQLKKYKHLKGNFGTAWHNQQREFYDIPAPVLFTTNCIKPPRANYKDRIFTTALVSYPEVTHIGEDKDFTPLINKALELGGYAQDTLVAGINGGNVVTTGFGHGTILSVADKVIEGVKSGAIRHFFLVGGCDGAHKERDYYRDFVKLAPKDTIILTLACGKFRFNDLDLGEIGGIPRLLDMGQCNDAYGAIQVAVALAGAFNCSVNELPLSLVLSWYEQKAVCILLTLLHLGIKNIKLGPKLPAFVSPNVLNFLVENFNIAPITTPEEDLKAILG